MELEYNAMRQFADSWGLLVHGRSSSSASSSSSSARVHARRRMTPRRSRSKRSRSRWPINKHVDEVTGVETTGHDWDGIRELNNPLPRWWLWTFYACIAFALGLLDPLSGMAAHPRGDAGPPRLAQP